MNVEDLIKHEQRGYQLAMAWLELGEKPDRVRDAVMPARVVRGTVHQLRMQAKKSPHTYGARAHALMAGCELAIEEWETCGVPVK